MPIPDNPQTRQEMYLSAIANGDSGGIPETPYTRKEMYLEAIATGDPSGIPETPYTREEMYLDEIARNGGGGGGGGDITVESKSISANGTYTAPTGKAYSPVTVSVPASAVDSGTKSITSNGTNQDVVGYAAVDVAVPNSYTESDEGKVVSNGELVAQTSDTATQNGTVDTTLINSLTVNVSGGAGSTIEDYATGAWPTGAISLGNTVTTIAEYAFYYNTAITSFSAPECTFLKWGALRGCSGLTSISLPKVTAIGRESISILEGYALAGCTGLQTIHLPELLTAYGGYNLSGLGKTGAFVTIVLPKITASGNHFFRSTKADAIDLGPNFAKIEDYSFYAGTYNTIILRRTSVVTAASASAISSLNESSRVYVPSALIDSYKAASNWSAKGDIFYAIEGSIYENAYADGTPIQTT